MSAKLQTRKFGESHNRQNNIPVQLTSYVGRKREIGEVRQFLETGRLLTLVGVGGSGKTRLAAQVGREVINQYKDGIFRIELTPLTDPTLVVQTAARAAGIRVNPTFELTETLVSYFKERKALLLFDNCEHLL